LGDGGYGAYRGAERDGSPLADAGEVAEAAHLVGGRLYLLDRIGCDDSGRERECVKSSLCGRRRCRFGRSAVDCQAFD
jgi:hypothetical protein